MEIRIAHLYPDILNLSADKGNILALKERASKRDIEIIIKEYNIKDNIDFDNTDIILIGGGCEKDKITVSQRLLEMKEDIITYTQKGGIIIAVAASYPIIGKSFEAEGDIHQGIGLVNMTTVYGKKRKTGNVILKSDILKDTVVGFENHTDNTTFDEDVCNLGEIIYGTEKGKKEGVLTKNIIATHLHGPILPKNPHLTDYIIKLALQRNHPDIMLSEIDTTYENTAHQYVLRRFMNN